MQGYKAVARFLEGIRDVHNMPESPPPETVESTRVVGRVTTMGAYVVAGLASLVIFWPIAIVPVGILTYTNTRSYMRSRERRRRFKEIGEY